MGAIMSSCFAKIKVQCGAIHMNKIGPRVKTVREGFGFTQEQLVAKCNLIGWNISRSTLAKIEARVRRVTDFEVSFLAKALKVPEQKFFEID